MAAMKRSASMTLDEVSRKKLRGAMARMLLEAVPTPQRAPSGEEPSDALPFKEEAEDVLKVAYLNRAMANQQVPETQKTLDPDLIAAMEWAEGKTAEEIMVARESTMKVVFCYLC